MDMLTFTERINGLFFKIEKERNVKIRKKSRKIALNLFSGNLNKVGILMLLEKHVFSYNNLFCRFVHVVFPTVSYFLCI